ncbi:hypothetical protein QTH97_23295 [Variovorax sp. J22R24]|uniref:hypothetical protein n=1 Tax=Variovorax gracilis TaxID=3053502 RepID=UPI00257506EA|nr:hypothetical protein [Variovorax sp. J22R24]MDM0107892.1 hypothetical protein [Variovorax sp. J22R24]
MKAITEASLDVLRAVGEGRHLDGTYAGFRQRLADAGVLKFTNALDHPKLVQWANAVAGADLQLIGMRDSELTWDWLRHVNSSRSGSVSTFKHVIRQALLLLAAANPPPSLDVARWETIASRDQLYAEAFKKLLDECRRMGVRPARSNLLRIIPGANLAYSSHPERFPALAKQVLKIKPRGA